MADDSSKPAGMDRLIDMFLAEHNFTGEQAQKLRAFLSMDPKVLQDATRKLLDIAAELRGYTSGPPASPGPDDPVPLHPPGGRRKRRT